MKTHPVIQNKLRYLLLILPLMALFACTNTPSAKPIEVKEEILHQDSTVYFANRKASISMRASFSNTIKASPDTNKPLIIQPLFEGYKLQFRSIAQENMLIDQVSIVADGRNIVLADNSFFIPPNKGITLSVSLEDTLFISQQAEAVLRFKFNNASKIITIKNHQISEFIIQ
jgi:hypothetical protein